MNAKRDELICIEVGVREPVEVPYKFLRDPVDPEGDQLVGIQISYPGLLHLARERQADIMQSKGELFIGAKSVQPQSAHLSSILRIRFEREKPRALTGFQK